MAATVVISRAGTDLTIPGDGSAVTEGFWFEEFTPARDVWRRNRVSSDWQNGGPQTSAVLDVTEVTMLIHARSATTDGLAAFRDELRAALHQWSFTLTHTEDGATTPDVYSCDCADIEPRNYKKPNVKSFAVTIPIPIPGA